MKLKINNISKIRSADIDFNSIAIIAGENNTGKSVIGKALFSFFDSLNNYEDQLTRSRIDEIKRLLNRFLHDNFKEIRSKVSLPLNILISRFENPSGRQMSVFDDDTYDDNAIVKLESIVANKETVENSFIKDILEQFKKFILSYSRGNFELNNMEIDISELTERINNVIETSDNELLKRQLTKKINSEFGDQVNNIFNSKVGHIEIDSNGTMSNITIEKNVVTELNNEASIANSIKYIDDPYILDNLEFSPFNYSSALNHRLALKRDLRRHSESMFERMATDSLVSEILRELNKEIDGDMVYDSDTLRYVYKKQESKYEINVENMSSGAKALLVLKTLLQNGSIGKNDIIVFDEPEVHLHPKWQVIFAQLIILLQKKMNLKLIITTHSPYFLNAIEILSLKNAINTKYYMTEKVNECDQYNIVDVTEHRDKIYKELAEPFQKLEDLKY